MEKVTLTREQHQKIKEWTDYSDKAIAGAIIRSFMENIFEVDEFAIITDLRKICPTCLNPVWAVWPELPKG